MWEIVVEWYDQLSTQAVFLSVIVILLLSAVLSDRRAVKRLFQILFTGIVIVFLAAAYFWTKQPIEQLETAEPAVMEQEAEAAAELSEEPEENAPQ